MGAKGVETESQRCPWGVSFPCMRRLHLMSRRREIHLTRHAQRRMKWRNISLDDVEACLMYPDRVEQMPTGRTNASKSIGKKLIRVSYVLEEERIMVVSVVDRNR